jgi:hypothetical protein
LGCVAQQVFCRWQTHRGGRASDIICTKRSLLSCLDFATE